jgi:hypothetical protein
LIVLLYQNFFKKTLARPEYFDRFSVPSRYKAVGGESRSGKSNWLIPELKSDCRAK